MKPIPEVTFHRFRSSWVMVWVLISMATSPLSGQGPPTLPQDLPLRETEPVADHAVQTADFQQPDAMGTATIPDLVEESTEPWSESLIPFEFSGEATWFSRLSEQLGGVDFTRLAGSLAIVLGGYFGFVWLTRRFGSGASRQLPSEVVEVLGQSPFGPRKTLQLVRLGSKLLLLIHSSEGTQLAGEINDPHEVEYLVSLCCGKKASRSAIAIRKATTVASSQPTTDLKKIMRQLQGVQENNSTGSVFEA